MSVASCPRCGNERHLGRCKSKATQEKAAAPPPVTIKAALEVPSGRGFRATIEDELFCIEQDVIDADDGQTYTHQVTLAPHEARQLVDWIEAKVKTA